MSQTEPQEKTEVSKPPIIVGDRKSSIMAEVKKRSGANFSACYQCRACGNGCPFYQGLDYPPNVIIRMLQYGLDQKVLESKAIWVCAACNTCASQCPNAVDIPAVMAACRNIAIEKGVAIGKPHIKGFHEKFLHVAGLYGRAHKLGIMWRYKLLTHDWFGDMGLGMQMMRKHKLELRPHRVKAMKEIKDLFKTYGRQAR